MRTIVCLDGGDETTLSWQELIDCRQEELDLVAAATAVTPDDLLTVIYTVGTDGPPRLVRLTHADVLAQVTELRERLMLGDGWRAISWQPMAGIAERLCTHYLPLAHGWQVSTCADPGAVAASLPEIRPEFFWAQPSLWEEMRASVLARFDGNPERAAAADRAAVLAALGLEQVRIAIVAASCPPDAVGFWRDYVIDGAKRWIGNGSIADVVVVWARDAEDGQVKGFLVELGTPGCNARVIVGQGQRTLGLAGRDRAVRRARPRRFAASRRE